VRFFPWGNGPHADSTGPDDAATPSPSALIEQLLAEVSAPNRAGPFFQRASRFKRLKRPEQERTLPAIYLPLEQILVDVDPAKKYTRQQLRQTVRTQYPSLLDLPSFGLVFEPLARQEVLLCRQFLTIICEQSYEILGATQRDALTATVTWLATIPDAASLPVPLAVSAPLPEAPSDWLALLARLSHRIYEHLEDVLGEAAASRIMGDSYQEVSETYVCLEGFPSLLGLLPDTLLDEHKIGLLSRTQLQRVILEKLEQVQSINDQLAAKNRELELAQEELRRAHDDLEIRVAERTEELRASNSQLMVEVMERARAENALIESEAIFRSVVQQATDAIILMDGRGTITGWNNGARDLFGYAETEIKGKSFGLLVPPRSGTAEAAGWIAAFLADMSSHGGKPVELSGRSQDGRDFPLELSMAAWETPKGSFLSSIIRDISERKAFEAELARQAHRDPLTDLPNRVLFTDRLQQALARAERAGSRVAVLFIDLDNFKVVNDSLGHQAGDRLLLAVAERLRSCVRLEDTVARFGGDEFTAVLESVTDQEQVVEVAERIRERLSDPVILEGREVFTAASIGIAVSSPGADQAESLMRNADLAMYRAKSQGKSRYEVFDHSMNALAMERLDLETDLRHALERGEFRVYYQPIVDLPTGRVGELEALVRWEHPARGLISPVQFIPLAEETGLIVPIGQFVLEEACRQVQAWQVQYADGHPLTVSVNLSLRQIQHPTLVEDVARAIRESGLDPASLRLELTESVVMEDVESTVATLERLKALGVELAIDDFGTGYSSLSYLKRFPVDVLKIDRSFVDRLGQDPHDTAIVRGVIELAKSLQLSVVGEGIETPDQMRHLQSLGCDRGQGFYFAKPMTPEATADLLATGDESSSDNEAA
jgi:diguanylate cyclase (GGDEF)-like protein/PAS domain S-box-containing protein